jgi:hypothetical protein
MKTSVKVGAAVIAVLVFALLLARTTRAQRSAATTTSASDTIANWPSGSKSTAQAIIKKYGPPAEVTPSMLVWHNNGPWKHTIVFRDEVDHNFPKPHKESLWQFIDYRVQPDAVSNVVRYNGSVVADRTKGELSARSDSEEMSFLSINLADAVATKRMVSDDARSYHTRAVMGLMSGQRDPYTQGLQFTVAHGGTADPDRATIQKSASAMPPR